MKVAVVVMPFAALTRPSLAAGLLQANLERAGIPCESVYLNLVMGDVVGPAAYRRFSSEAPTTALAGEWVFSQMLFGDRCSTWHSYRDEVLDHPVWGTSSERHDEILRLLELAPMFLERAFAARDWGAYDVVAFTSTFEQTLPSLCLARHIRERHPTVALILGGANFEGCMGRPYLEHFDFIDFICTAEGDTSFVQLCASLAEWRGGRASTIDVPSGFLFRDNGVNVPSSQPPTPVALECSPMPAYDDFFRGAAERLASVDGGAFNQWLPVEASRGCWWGEKAHCTFCGLNGDTMRFRAKSAAQVIRETDDLVRRHAVRRLQFADNILGTSFFDDLLPYWAERQDGIERFFEIKSSLTRSELTLMRRAGVTTVQAGVESLSDATLRLMRKGVSAAQNVALLRWCCELGIDALWNIIYAFPCEALADYPTQLAALRDLVHLSPPDAAAPIRMDRFSPNFANWREHGFTRIAPMPAYRHVFPVPDDVLSELAYYFHYDHPQLDEALKAGADVARFVSEWQERRRRRTSGVLSVAKNGDRLIVEDTRFTRPPTRRVLDDAEAALVMACDAPASPRTAIGRASGLAGPGACTLDFDAPLARLLESRVIGQLGDRLVTLACVPDHVRESLGHRWSPAMALVEPESTGRMERR
jgi:ribosomal peptide maturation radical SAM protein 1